MQNAVQVRLADAVIVLRELTPSEVLQAMRASGDGGSRQTRELLAMSIVEVDGRPVRYVDLEGEGLKRHLPRTRSFFQASRAWAKVHAPTDEELQGVIDSLSTALDASGERWTVTLPPRYAGQSARVVELREVAPETVEDALAVARRSSKSPAAAELAAVIETLKRSVVAIDGQAASVEDWDAHFTVRDTQLLGHVLKEALGFDGEDVEVGEPKPGSGT